MRDLLWAAVIDTETIGVSKTYSNEGRVFRPIQRETFLRYVEKSKVQKKQIFKLKKVNSNSINANVFIIANFSFSNPRLLRFMHRSTIHGEWVNRRCRPWSIGFDWRTFDEIQTKNVPTTKSTSNFKETHPILWSIGRLWLSCLLVKNLLS